MLLRPGDAHHTDYQAAFNLRTALKPQLRALCKTSKAAGVMVDWCRSNGLPFAVRCGGHSYEGFSQSTSVVIDMRLMNAITVDPRTSTATVGAGDSLGGLYRAIAVHGLAFTGAVIRPSESPATCSAVATDSWHAPMDWPATAFCQLI